MHTALRFCRPLVSMGFFGAAPFSPQGAFAVCLCVCLSGRSQPPPAHGAAPRRGSVPKHVSQASLPVTPRGGERCAGRTNDLSHHHTPAAAPGRLEPRAHLRQSARGCLPTLVLMCLLKFAPCRPHWPQRRLYGRPVVAKWWGCAFLVTKSPPCMVFDGGMPTNTTHLACSVACTRHPLR